MPKSKKENKDKNLNDDKLLDFYINENKQIQITPQNLESIENDSKKQLKIKLKNAILQKNNKRFLPNKKYINEQTEKIQAMMKHPKMTQEILELYAKVISIDMSKPVPSPIEIFDNIESYKKIYYQYILGILNKMKEDKLDISKLDSLLDNPYGQYMSKCIGCPLNPFNK